MNWIICPVRDMVQFTERAVESFLKQDIDDINILILDNGFTEDTFLWWKDHPDRRIIYIRNKPPLSVAESWNNGLRFVFKGEDYALVVNNDVVLRPDTYRLLLADGGGFVTCVGNNDPECVEPLEDGTHVQPNGSTRPHPDFSCYLIRKHIYESVGPFDENFRNAFCEDWDYHCRLHQAGVKAYCIDLPFYHFGSATVKHIDKKMAVAIHEQAARNRDYFEEKWGFRGGTEAYSEFFKKGKN